jgi:hypothetical protein
MGARSKVDEAKVLARTSELNSTLMIREHFLAIMMLLKRIMQKQFLITRTDVTESFEFARLGGGMSAQIPAVPSQAFDVSLQPFRQMLG